MIFQFSFFSYKSLETREYFSRRDKNLLDLLMIPRNDPLRKEKKNLRPDFKFFDCSNPPPPPPPPSCYEPCNLSIGGRFSLARRTKGSFTCEQRKRHLIRKAADEISSLYPVSSIWPFWGTPILRGLADRRRQPGDREVNEFPGRMIGRATVEKGTGEVGGREGKGRKGKERRRKGGGMAARGTKEEAVPQQEHAYLACIDYLPWVNSIANRRNALLLHLYSSLSWVVGPRQGSNWRICWLSKGRLVSPSTLRNFDAIYYAGSTCYFSSPLSRYLLNIYIYLFVFCSRKIR